MFFNFCMDIIPGISFKFLSSRMINQSQQNLLHRHAQGRTISGTRSYHFYHPISANQIGCKYICSDLNISATFDFSPAKYKKVKSMDFVACWYNFHWWMGLVLSVNEPQLEVDVKFMYPHGPSPSFFWPEQDDTCTIPYNQIICTIDTPFTSSSDKSTNFLNKVWKQFNNMLTTKTN